MPSSGFLQYDMSNLDILGVHPSIGSMISLFMIYCELLMGETWSSYSYIWIWYLLGAPLRHGGGV